MRYLICTTPFMFVFRNRVIQSNNRSGLRPLMYINTAILNLCLLVQCFSQKSFLISFGHKWIGPIISIIFSHNQKISDLWFIVAVVVSQVIQQVLPSLAKPMNLNFAKQHFNAFDYDDDDDNDELQWIPPFQLSIIYSKYFYIDYNDKSIKSIELYLHINSH